jgi:uncharacterized membrane protein YgcG
MFKFDSKVAGKNVGFLVAALLAFAATLIVGACYLWHMMTGEGLPNPSTMTSIPLVGLILFVSLVALLVLIYKLTGMEDKKEALGLPSGSVRALIAICLVLMFGSLGVFVHQQLSASTIGVTLLDVPQCVVDNLIQKFSASNVFAQPATNPTSKGDAACKAGKPAPDNGGGSGGANGSGGGANGSGGAGGNGGGAGANGGGAGANGSSSAGAATSAANTATAATQHYNVTYYPPANKDADDFGKLFFEKIAMIFATVVAFYFGSSTTAAGVAKGVAAANASGDPGPTPTPVPIALLQIRALVGAATTDAANAKQANDNLQKKTDPACDAAKKTAAQLNQQIVTDMQSIQANNTDAEAAAKTFGTALTNAENSGAQTTILKALETIKPLAAAIAANAAQIAKLTC